MNNGSSKNKYNPYIYSCNFMFAFEEINFLLKLFGGYLFWGNTIYCSAHGVMLIVVGNGHDNMSSNPGRG